MIFELLGHVAVVVSMRNAVPCGISNAKESRMIFVMPEILAVAKWYSLARFLEPSRPGLNNYLCHSIFNGTTFMRVFVR